MIYTVDNTARAGKPIALFDGDGKKVKGVLSFNDETGGVVVYDKNEKGEPFVDDSGDLARKTIYPKQPITVVEVKL